MRLPAPMKKLGASVLALVPALALMACKDKPTDAMNAMPASSAPVSTASGAVAGGDFASRFEALHRTVYAENTHFSGSAMSADLAALEPLLVGPYDTADHRFQLYDLQAVVFGRRGMDEEAAEKAELALGQTHHMAPARFAKDRFFLRFTLPEWLQAVDDERALGAVRAVLADYPLASLGDLPAALPSAEDARPTRGQVLALYEREGYLLHELERYDDALATNLRTLPAARALLPEAEQYRLQGLLTNIAQNHHALGQLAQAEAPLLERLKWVRSQSDDERVLDTYFQLMVLAHERGQAQQADAWLARHVAHSAAMKDPAAQAESKALQQELAQRRATGQ